MSNATSGVRIQANGTLYTGGDVKIVYNGHSFVGVDAIKYDEKQEKKDTNGMSREPVGRLLGPVTYGGSVTLKAFEVDALQKAAGGSIRGLLPSDIVVVYFDPQASIVKTDTLLFTEFTGASWEVKGAGDEILIECELRIGGIRYE